MKVLVINQHGRPLMPTTPRLARIILKEGRAKIVARDPFTIQLLYGTRGYTQPVTLGIDAGYETIGYSAVTEKEELVGGEMNALSDVSERITERQKYRRTRRNRLRHRAPRFDNPSGSQSPTEGNHTVGAVSPEAKVRMVPSVHSTQARRSP